MRKEQEIRELQDELDKLTGFIADYGMQQEFEDDLVGFSNDVSDALSWVLEVHSTETFRSDSFLDVPRLQKIAAAIETRTGEDLASYE